MADTQLIKDRVDIVQLIQEYLPLKKAGVHWKANCPFHNEKSPSFMVHPEKQIWHCFGCGKGGDIFSFIQEIEGLQFGEALKLLALRAGVQLATNPVYEGVRDQRSRIIDINALAAAFFHETLLQSPLSQEAREYLVRRALKSETIAEWQLGFVPDQWDLLTKFLLKKGCAIDDLIAAGLTIKRDDADASSGRGFYDRFRGRIMFPIWDVHGSVVGFTGRVLVETEHSGGKYVNTPQTLAYDKSRVLYGLNKAKLEIKTKNKAVLVEGQMDVIACHQAGMKNVIAASGTALTHDQVRLIKRYTDTVAMAFDADAAGENAGRRGIGVALEEGLRVSVIRIPDGFAKDADECIKKDPQVWAKAVAEAEDIMAWLIQLARKRYNVGDPRERQLAATMLAEELNRIPHLVERDFWVQRIADAVRVEPSVILQEIAQIRRKIAQSTPRFEAKKPLATAPAAPTKPLLSPEERHFELLLRTWWGILLTYPALFSEAMSKIDPQVFVGTSFFELYDFWRTTYTTKELTSQELAEEWIRRGKGEDYAAYALQSQRDYPDGLSLSQAKIELNNVAERIALAYKKQQRKLALYAMKEAEQSGDPARVAEALAALQKLSSP
jgi:DNA primase